MRRLRGPGLAGDPAAPPTPTAGDLESTLLGEAPSAAIDSMLLFICITAWTLRHLDEMCRED